MTAGEPSSVPADTAEEIRKATRRAFAKYGYVDLSMAKISDEFDRSQSLLHYHFDTKERLIAFFLRRERAGFEEFLSSIPDAPDQRFEIVLSSLVDLEYLRSHDLAAAYVELYGHAAHSGAIQSELVAFDETLYGALREAIADGIDDGSLAPVDPDLAARTIFAFHESALFRTAMGRDVGDLDAALKEFVLDALRLEDTGGNDG